MQDTSYPCPWDSILVEASEDPIVKFNSETSVLHPRRPLGVAHRDLPDGSVVAAVAVEMECFQIPPLERSQNRRGLADSERSMSAMVDALTGLMPEREIWYVLARRQEVASDGSLLRSGWLAIGRSGTREEAALQAETTLDDLLTIQTAVLGQATMTPVANLEALRDLVLPSCAPHHLSLRRVRWEPPTRVHLSGRSSNCGTHRRPGALLPWKPENLLWAPLAQALASRTSPTAFVVRIKTAAIVPSQALAQAEADLRSVALERESLRDSRVEDVASLTALGSGNVDPLAAAACKRLTTLRSRCFAADACLATSDSADAGLVAVAAASLVTHSQPNSAEQLPATPIAIVHLPEGSFWEPLDTARSPELLLGPQEAATLIRAIEPPSDESSPLPCTRSRWLPLRAPSPEGTPLGMGQQYNRTVEVRIPKEARFRHTYVVGQTGTGKSTMLLHMILDDIRAGHGVTVLDPHGTLISETLARIPHERIDDVIIVDPSDASQFVGLNPLCLDREDPHTYAAERDRVIDELFDTFETLYDMKACGGPMFEKYFRFFASLVMGSSRPTEYVPVLPMIEALMIDPVLIDSVVERLGAHDPTIGFAATVIRKARGDGALSNIAPYITSKLDRFCGPGVARRILCQSRSLDFAEVVAKRRILLVELSPTRLGRDASALIARQIILRLSMALMSRKATHGTSAHLLYADEFQNYASERFGQMLSEARKYLLGLVLAHQHTSQLVQGGNTKILDAVLGNVGTTVAFRLGSNDAALMERSMAPRVTAADISGLPNYRAFVQSAGELGTETFSLKTRPAPGEKTGVESLVREVSADRYSRSRADVDRELIEDLAALRSLGSRKPKQVVELPTQTLEA